MWQRNPDLAYRLDCYTRMINKIVALEEGVVLNLKELSTLRDLLNCSVTQSLCDFGDGRGKNKGPFDVAQLQRFISVLHPPIMAHFAPEGVFSTEEAERFVAFEEDLQQARKKHKSETAE